MEHRPIPNGSESFLDWRVRQAAALAREQYRNPRLSLKTMGGQLGLSLRYLGCIFKQATRISFRGYLRSVRMKKAAELMLDPLLNLKQIAAATGYTSVSNFHREFRASYGATPREYRHRRLCA